MKTETPIHGQVGHAVVGPDGTLFRGWESAVGKLLWPQSRPTISAQAPDNVFQHPNVGPFVAHHQLLRLVTSNPTSAHVQRVALVFNDNGSSVRDELKAVVKAVLVDASPP